MTTPEEILDRFPEEQRRTAELTAQWREEYHEWARVRDEHSINVLEQQMAAIRAHQLEYEFDEIEQLRTARLDELTPGISLQAIESAHAAENHRLRFEEWAAYQKWDWKTTPRSQPDVERGRTDRALPEEQALERARQARQDQERRAERELRERRDQMTAAEKAGVHDGKLATLTTARGILQKRLAENQSLQVELAAAQEGLAQRQDTLFKAQMRTNAQINQLADNTVDRANWDKALPALRQRWESEDRGRSQARRRAVTQWRARQPERAKDAPERGEQQQRRTMTREQKAAMYARKRRDERELRERGERAHERN